MTKPIFLSNYDAPNSIIEIFQQKRVLLMLINHFLEHIDHFLLFFENQVRKLLASTILTDFLFNTLNQFLLGTGQDNIVEMFGRNWFKLIKNLDDMTFQLFFLDMFRFMLS